MADIVPRGSLHTAIVYINGQWADQNSASGQSSVVYAPFGSQTKGVPLAPGDHELSVQLDNLPGEYVCEVRHPLVGQMVSDKDTGELLDEIAFPVKTEVLPANARVTWRFTVKASGSRAALDVIQHEPDRISILEASITFQA